MPRRSRPPRWVLVVIAVAGTFVGTAAAAQPAEHHPRPPTTTVPVTEPPTTVVDTTVPDTTVPDTTVPDTTVPDTTVPDTTVPTTTVPDTTVPTTTVPPPPPPSTTEPPIQSTTTTAPKPPPPSTTEPPIQSTTTTTTTVPPPPPGENGDPPVTAAAGGTDDTGPDTGAPPLSGDDALDASDGRDEVAELPSAAFRTVDGRTLLAPAAPESPDTRPLWLAVLLGLAAGIGLTLTASVVVSNLEHPES